MEFLQYLIDEYYKLNNDIERPNINLFFLYDNEFDSKVKKDFRLQTNCKIDTKDIVGNLILDKKFKKNKIANIYIRKNDKEFNENHYILVIFHELSHIHTMPSSTEDDVIKYNNKKGKNYTLDGYYFWREFIATYLTYKTLLKTDIINLEELYNTKFDDWNKDFEYYCDDLFALSILLNKELEDKKNILKTYLKNILNDLENYKDINLSVLNKIGKQLVNSSPIIHYPT